MKFFQLKMTCGLALGESWPLLAQPQRSTDVQGLSLPIVVGRLSWPNLHKSGLVLNTDVRRGEYLL